jgi:hypothetical protein
MGLLHMVSCVLITHDECVLIGQTVRETYKVPGCGLSLEHEGFRAAATQ